MAVATDDDVVVHRDPERLGDFDDLAGHRDIGVGRRWVAGGVIKTCSLSDIYRSDKRDQLSAEPSGLFHSSR